MDSKRIVFQVKERAAHGRRSGRWLAHGVRALGLLSAIGLAACGAEAPDEALGDSDEQVRAESIVVDIDRLAPAIDGATRVPVRVAPEQPELISARGAALAIAIPRRNSGWVELAHADDAARAGLRVGLPLAELEQSAVIAEDGTVTYQRGLAATDVAVQAFDRGVRIQTVMSDASAPVELVYPVDLPAGGKILPAADGSLLVVDGAGAPLGGFGAPWAKDSDGQDVATRYEVRGDTVVQIVAHTDAPVHYPVVADPWLGIDLIANAHWGWRDGGWTLFVSPTGWARANGGGYAVGVAGWNELYSKYKNAGLNTNLGGMKDQFICHQQFAFYKSTYNLDEWRPDVSYAATVAAGCNPGGPGD
jgi:hypothetical protein